MATQQEKKEFALNAIKPYYKDPSLCSFSGNQCTYLNKEGKKCVAGKYMKDPSSFNNRGSIGEILLRYPQNEVFMEKFVGILDDKEWNLLQKIHDCLALPNSKYILWTVEEVIKELRLFTLEELQA